MRAACTGRIEISQAEGKSLGLCAGTAKVEIRDGLHQEINKLPTTSASTFNSYAFQWQMKERQNDTGGQRTFLQSALWG
jgi:hypothetical protein